MNPRLLILAFLLLISKNSLSQSSPYQPMEITPASPDAASLGKYADYPVNLNTGTINVPVPIYTIKTKSLTLPISINYHASGIKVNDKASNVGLGWSLSAGGVINRQMNGTPDEYGYFYNNPIAQADTLQYFGNAQRLIDDPTWDHTIINPYRVAHVLSFHLVDGSSYLTNNEEARRQYLNRIVRYKTEDTEPDRFNYNFNGRSGLFMYDNNGNIHSTSLDPIKITVDKLGQPQARRIEITTEDGTLYRFGRDSNGNDAYEETQPQSNNYGQNNSYVHLDYASSWYLTEIISADKQDTITLKYKPYTTSETNYFQQFKTIGDSELNTYISTPFETDNCIASNGTVETNYSTITRQSRYLEEIYFSNGKVVFNQVADRQDSGGYRLASVDVFSFSNGSYNKIENIELDNSKYFQRNSPGGKILKLEKLIYKNSSNLEKSRYEFKYNSTSLPHINSNAQDYWGYYNGQNNNTSLIPQATYAQYPNCLSQTQSVNRNPSSSSMKAAVLEEVKYPTGGVAKFEFEPHVTNEGTIGGLRIKSTKQYLNDTDTQPVLVRRYSYNVGQSINNQKNNATRSITTSANTHFYDYVIYHSEPVDIQHNYGSSAEYTSVTEYFSETGGGNGKIIYNYLPTVVDLELPVQNSPYPNTLTLSYKNWKQGRMSSKTTFAYKNSTYKIVSSITNQYTDLDEIIINALKAQTLSQSTNENTLGIMAYNYDVSIGKNALSKTIAKGYDTDENLISSTETDYDYELEHFFPKETSVYASANTTDKQKTTYLYPHTVSNPNTVENQLKTNHMIGAPLSMSSYKVDSGTETLLSTQETIYKDWGNNVILPEFIKSSKGSNSLQNRFQFVSYYTNGNVKELSKTDGIHTYFVWGYNGQYPIAKIENFKSSQITNTVQIQINDAITASNNDASASTENNLRTMLSNLRNSSALANSMVTTYTYNPLIGLTSITEPKGYTMYYEYDEFNRLKQVKDASGNILSENEYNYKNQ